MKVKRTYNLSVETVSAVRDLVERDHVAPSQDALVEMALRDFLLTVQHAEDARLFAQAAVDPEMIAESALLAAEFATADRETWPE